MPVLPKKPGIRRLIPHRLFRLTSASAASGSQGLLYDGEPENCRRRWREFLSIIVHLLLMQLIFDAFRLETRLFRALVLLATAALPVHYMAPYRWKKPIFVAVSILGMIVVNGLLTSAGVLAVSAVLLVFATAPLPWRARALLIAALAMILAGFQIGRAHV